MPVTFDSIKKTGSATYQYEWSGTGPYEIWLNGALIVDSTGQEQTTATEIEYFSSDSEEPEPLEVIDTDSETSKDAQNVQNAPVAILQWRGEPGMEGYRVQEDVSGTWTTRAYIPHRFPDDNDGGGYYKYTTPALTHLTEYDFRVLAIDSYPTGTTRNTHTSAPLVFTFTLRRNPAPPSISASYANPNLTISAR